MTWPFCIPSPATLEEYSWKMLSKAYRKVILHYQLDMSLPSFNPSKVDTYRGVRVRSLSVRPARLCLPWPLWLGPFRPVTAFCFPEPTPTHLTSQSHTSQRKPSQPPPGPPTTLGLGAHFGAPAATVWQPGVSSAWTAVIWH